MELNQIRICRFHHLIKKTTDTTWTSWEVEKCIQKISDKYQKATLELYYVLWRILEQYLLPLKVDKSFTMYGNCRC